jgi:hypothetical protein
MVMIVKHSAYQVLQKKIVFFPCMLHYSTECEKAWCWAGLASGQF